MASGTELKVKVAKLAQARPAVREALDNFEAAMKAAREAKGQLSKALSATPEWGIFEASGGSPVVRVDQYGAVDLVTVIRRPWEARRDETLAPQTLNALITGKLLTDEEKRQLLANQGICLTKPEDKAQPSDSDALLVLSDWDDEIPF